MSRLTRDRSSSYGGHFKQLSFVKTRSATGLFPYRRRLRIEPLEDRRLLATIIVNTIADQNDGIGVGGISLRDAITAAAPGDNINFAAALTSGGPATIHLLNIGGAQLTINKNLSINGPGSHLLTINAFDPTPATNNADGSRVFNIDDGTGIIRTVQIGNLTISGGDVNGNGGGIRSLENVSLTNMVVTGNAAINGSGGGIYQDLNNLTITGSTIRGNTAQKGGGVYQLNDSLTVNTTTIDRNTASDSGAGIFSMGGTATVQNSMVSGNVATISAGGIEKRGGTLNVTNSTLQYNRSNKYGGGIWSYSAASTITGSTLIGNRAGSYGAPTVGSGGGILQTYGTMSVRSSTITGNTSTGNGAGIYTYFGTLTVAHSTIVQNLMSAYGSAPSGNGGGIHVSGSAVQLDHAIVAQNRDLAINDDINGPVTARFSLIGSNLNATITNNGGNQIGTNASPINPLLGPLLEQGGQPTFALLPGSPAIDAGDPAAVPGSGTVPLNDQRGAPFVRRFDGDGVGGARLDIGAYEKQTVATTNFTVDTLLDEMDGNYSAGDLSLREAIGLASGGGTATPTIGFAPAIYANGAARISLIRGALQINRSLSIVGPGADALTIDASGNDLTPGAKNGEGSRVFTISDQNSATVINVQISGLTIAGADTDDHGGGINNSETLAINAAKIRDNFGLQGGGIQNSGSLTVTNSTISGNSSNFGGGLFNFGIATLTNTSIAGNFTTAGGEGGGIYVSSDTTTLTNCTVTGNTAGSEGGGIHVDEEANLVLSGTTVSGNSAVEGGGIYGQETSTLTITNSQITLNTATVAGGGIWHHGTLNVTRSTISGNVAHLGGGVYAQIGQTIITDSTLSGNQASYGAGLNVFQGSASIVRSTISGNMAPHTNGGGITVNNGTLTVFTSTITGNVSGSGGGILSYYSTTSIQNSTITNNYGSFAGGGLNKFGTGSLSLSNTIVAGNLGVGNTFDDIRGAVSANYSLIGVNTGATITNNGGNQIGTSAVPRNPLLGPLADNGGETRTHALLPGSTAIDTGDPSFVQFPNTDQRGAPFVRFANGVGGGGAIVDIGAYEFQNPPAPQSVFGDFNRDGQSGAADYVLWRKTLGQAITPYNGADGDGDGAVDPGDYQLWKRKFGDSPAGSGGGEQVASVEGGVGSGNGEQSSSGAAVEAQITADGEAHVDEFLRNSNLAVSEKLPYVGLQAKQEARAVESARENGLMAWLASQRAPDRGEEIGAVARSSGESEDCDVGDNDGVIDAFDAVFEAGIAGTTAMLL